MDTDAQAYMIFIKDHKDALGHLDWKERMPVLHKAWSSLSEAKKEEYVKRAVKELEKK